jgi:AbrB family transcriptional regulator (stage V sporulation protein T)
MCIILLVFHIITIQHEIWKNNRRNITYMKATGIVRRIDDLGRVVIPKEIRRTLRIKEGTPLEIFTDREGEVILKKYSPIGELSIFAKEYVEALAQTTGMTACITDHDQVVAASGHGSREYEGKGISRELDRVIAEREMKCYYGEEKGKIALVENQKENKAGLIIQPIICAGDAIGSVALVGKSNGERPGNSEKMLVQTAAGFLGRQMEQ